MDYNEFKENLDKLKNALDRVNADINQLSYEEKKLGEDFFNKNSDFSKEINNLIKENLSKAERDKIAKDMLEKKTQIDSLNNKEVISNLFSINIGNIKDVNLQNGKNIFVVNTGDVPIAIENSSDLNMVELLKKTQAENSNFQTGNPIENAKKIIESIGYDNNRLLEIVYIDKIDEYDTIIKQLPKDEYNAFSKLVNDIKIKNESLENDDKILYFNIKNQFAVARNGKVYDVKRIIENDVEKLVVDESSDNQYNNENVESIKYNDDTIKHDSYNKNITTSETTSGEISEEKIEVNQNSFDDEIKSEELFNKDEIYLMLSDKEKKDLLNEIREVAKGKKEASSDYIRDYAELYNKKLEERKNNSFSYRYVNKNNGYINLVLITTILICLIAIILLTILI